MAHGLANRELHARHHQRRSIEVSREEALTDRALACWLLAARFRRLVNRALERHGVTFAQWRVLDAADRLVREYSDTVGQHEIGERCEMDESTVSMVLGRLRQRGLVDIEPEFWGQLNGVLIPTKGQALLAATRGLLVRIASQVLEPAGFAR